MTTEPATDQLNTILNDLATMPREEARSKLYRQLDGLLNNGPASALITLMVDAVIALADERGSHASKEAAGKTPADKPCDPIVIVDSATLTIRCAETSGIIVQTGPSCLWRSLARAVATHRCVTSAPKGDLAADKAWAALDEVLMPIVASELARQAVDRCDTCGDTGEIYEEGQPTGVHGGFAPCPDCRTTGVNREEGED